MFLITQASFANLFYETYSKTADANNHIRSVVLDIVNQLIQQNSSTITNKPIGDDIINRQIRSSSTTTLPQIDAYFNAQPAVSTNIVLVGETHADAADTARANGIIAAINAAAAPTPSLAVFEKGMTYPAITTVELIRESNLASGVNLPPNFIDGIPIADRSFFVAGYLVARAACGNQNVKNNFLLFYGEMHSDIFTAFDTVARQSGSGSHLLKIPRFFNLIMSNS